MKFFFRNDDVQERIDNGIQPQTSPELDVQASKSKVKRFCQWERVSSD